MAYYEIGALVRVKKNDQQVVVCECHADTDEVRYGAGGHWWYKHDDLEFVAAPTEQTIEQARAIVESDSAGDEVDDDGEL